MGYVNYMLNNSESSGDSDAADKGLSSAEAAHSGATAASADLPASDPHDTKKLRTKWGQPARYWPGF